MKITHNKQCVSGSCDVCVSLCNLGVRDAKAIAMSLHGTSASPRIKFWREPICSEPQSFFSYKTPDFLH